MNIRDMVKQRIPDLYETDNITISKPTLESGLTQSILNSIINTGNNNSALTTIAKICVGPKITVHGPFGGALFENIEQEIG